MAGAGGRFHPWRWEWGALSSGCHQGGPCKSVVARRTGLAATKAQESFVEQSVPLSHCWGNKKAGACLGRPAALSCAGLGFPMPVAFRWNPHSKVCSTADPPGLRPCRQRCSEVGMRHQGGYLPGPPSLSSGARIIIQSSAGTHLGALEGDCGRHTSGRQSFIWQYREPANARFCSGDEG